MRVYETEIVNHNGSHAAYAHGIIQSDISGPVETGGASPKEGLAQDCYGTPAKDRSEGSEGRRLRSVAEVDTAVLEAAGRGSSRLVAACRQASGAGGRTHAGYGAEGCLQYRIVTGVSRQ